MNAGMAASYSAFSRVTTGALFQEVKIDPFSDFHYLGIPRSIPEDGHTLESKFPCTPISSSDFFNRGFFRHIDRFGD
jgi:hypothetical protein